MAAQAALSGVRDFMATLRTGASSMIAAAAIAALVGFVVSLLVAWWTLAYATRHGMLDQPGRRRSHQHPTPRGGGLGIAAALLLVGVPAWYLPEPSHGAVGVVAVGLALLMVTLVGWRDDRAPLPVLPRIVVHLAASLLVAGAILAGWTDAPPGAWWALVPLVLVLAGYINIHNFMDGIDGILGLQGLFVMLGYLVLAFAMHAPGIAAFAATGAAACLAFLGFNAPPARIFMGDVGSGTLGLAIAVMGLLLVRADVRLLWPCLILSSAFLMDGGLTLLHRALTGQRWYSPHRQHLYQWLVRVNWSHARTDVAYVTWNLVIVTPLAWAAVRWPAHGFWDCVAACVLAAVAWHVGKHACLVHVRRSNAHEAA